VEEVNRTEGILNTLGAPWTEGTQLYHADLVLDSQMMQSRAVHFELAVALLPMA
jgi:hypothetical protein